jgi:hypothetical protein
MDELGKALSSELIKTPTIEKYRKIMGGRYWNYTQRTILYLREYDAGLQGVAYLLHLTDRYKNGLTEKEIKTNRFKLWSFYLNLLDKLDRWEEYIETVEKFKQDPEGKEFLSEAVPVLTPEGRKAYIAASDRAAWYHAVYAIRKKGDPSAQTWIVSHIVERQRIIQKRIDRQKDAKSVKHLMHKRPDEITDEEYRRRIEVLKFWFEYPQKWKEWARETFRNKRLAMNGPCKE